MKLLICTQKVDQNDSILGFFHGWINEFSKHVAKLTVICLEKGEYNLPENVKVLSLGKEKNLLPTAYRLPPANRLKYIYNFYRYITNERRNYDIVFVHMNSEYIVLAGWLWKLLNKPVSLWYVHRALPWQLKIAEKFVKNIFTASNESCNLRSNKISILGHGIDTKKFINPPYEGGARRAGDVIPPFPLSRAKPREKGVPERSEGGGLKKSPLERGAPHLRGGVCNIICVGRISPIKNQKLLLKAIDILCRDRTLPCPTVQIIGGPVYPSDKEYEKELKEYVQVKNLGGIIKFLGPVSNEEIVEYYNEANLSINLCPTGGVDKAVLESMACGLPVIALNKTFKGIFHPYEELMILDNDDKEELAEKIKKIINLSGEEKEKIAVDFRKIIEAKFSLENLILNILKNLNNKVPS